MKTKNQASAQQKAWPRPTQPPARLPITITMQNSADGNTLPHKRLLLPQVLHQHLRPRQVLHLLQRRHLIRHRRQVPYPLLRRHRPQRLRLHRLPRPHLPQTVASTRPMSPGNGEARNAMNSMKGACLLIGKAKKSVIICTATCPTCREMSLLWPAIMPN